MKPLPVMVVAAACATIVGCGTVRENQYNETPINQDVEYRSSTHYHDADVVYVRPTHRLAHVYPGHEVVRVTRYYYVD